MASSWMGMSTVLLEGVSRRWVRSGTFTRCQCLNGTYKMMRVRRKIVFHPSSIHREIGRKRKRPIHGTFSPTSHERATERAWDALAARRRKRKPLASQTGGSEGRGEEEACRHDGSRRAYIDRHG